MVRVFDCFPFYNELDVLEIRLHELDSVVDKFVILEANETYGGQPKDFILTKAVAAGRFDKFKDKMVVYKQYGILPPCTDRTTGREREAYQRNQLLNPLIDVAPTVDDYILFSDCDEIPSAAAVRTHVASNKDGVYRFKQNSYYYTVNNLVDYGHDWASRARIGKLLDLTTIQSFYDFRMANKNTEQFVIENGGWHFGYFGGIENIKNKVATMSPFLSEYKLFGDIQLVRDILAGKDLHHRRCELPLTFARRANADPTLPAYYLQNQKRFEHFTNDWILEHYGAMVPELARRG